MTDARITAVAALCAVMREHVEQDRGGCCEMGLIFV
jgi:hypothetical protein